MDHYKIYNNCINLLEEKIEKIQQEADKQRGKLEGEINTLHKEKSRLESSIKKASEAIRQRNFALEQLQKEMGEKSLIPKGKWSKAKFFKLLKNAKSWDDFCFELGNAYEESIYPIDLDE